MRRQQAMRDTIGFGRCFLVATLLLAACATAQQNAASTANAIGGAVGQVATTAVTGSTSEPGGAAPANATAALIGPNGQRPAAIFQPAVVGDVTTRPLAPEGGYFPIPPGIKVHLISAVQHALIAYVEKFYHTRSQIAQAKLNTITRFRHAELHFVRSVSGLQARWFSAGLPGPFLRPAVPIPNFPAHLATTAFHIRKEYENLKAHTAQQWIQIGIDWVNQFRHIVQGWEAHHLHARTAWFHLVGFGIPFPPDAFKTSTYHFDERANAAEVKVPCPACGEDGFSARKL